MQRPFAGSRTPGAWMRVRGNGGAGAPSNWRGGEPMGGGDDGDCGDRAGGECRRAAARLGARFRSEMGSEDSRGRTLLLGDPGDGWGRRPGRPGASRAVYVLGAGPKSTVVPQTFLSHTHHSTNTFRCHHCPPSSRAAPISSLANPRPPVASPLLACTLPSSSRILSSPRPSHG